MPIENRKVKCDVCDKVQWEEGFNNGWPGWSQISGIGAKAPEKGAPVKTENLECWLCPTCKGQVSNFINRIQIEAKERP